MKPQILFALVLSAGVALFMTGCSDDDAGADGWQLSKDADKVNNVDDDKKNNKDDWDKDPNNKFDGACGDNKKGPGEACDGSDLGGLTCVDLGYVSGTLSCTKCQLDAGPCVEPAPNERPVCGDGEKRAGEACDGADLGDLDCADFGYSEGDLGCSASCQLDLRDCGETATSVCGNGEKELGETCDGNDFDGLGCQDIGYYGGDLGCDQSCQISKDNCTLPPPDDLPECGDGVKDPGQGCDGADLGGLECEDIGFTGGELGCSTDCKLDFKGCADDDDGKGANCGNGLLDPGETCDGQIGDLTCMGLGFSGGSLSCDSTWCFLDTSACR